MKIKIFFGLVIIALIGLTGCNINPSDDCMEVDVLTRDTGWVNEQDIPGTHKKYIRYSTPWYPEVINEYVKAKFTCPCQYIYVKLEVRDSRYSPWHTIPGTPTSFRRLGYNQSYSQWYMTEEARFTIYAISTSDFTYSFTYDW